MRLKKQFIQKFLGSGLILTGLMFGACSEMESVPEPIPTADLEMSQSTALKLVARGESPQVIIARDGDEMGATSRATTAAGNDRGRFNLTLRYVTPVTDRQRSVFETAAGRWERIIIGDVPSITADGFVIPSAFVGFPPVAADGETIDDIIIEVAIAPIDGPGSILGQAGPRYIRTSDELTLSGVMFFDVDDLDFLDELDLFEEVIVHEMGHVLGVGTLWNTTSRTLRQGLASNPYFAGQKANTHWNAEGGTGLLPVENIGGPGTAGSHWREATLRNELMTGFINLGVNPLSRITAGSVRDLGYNAALVGEKYNLPKGTAGVAAKTDGVELQGINISEMEQLLQPIGVVSVGKN